MLDFEISLGPFRLRFALSAAPEEVGDVHPQGDVFSTVERAPADDPYIYEDRVGFRAP